MTKVDIPRDAVTQRREPSRVLLADDETSLLNAYARTLRDAGYTVDTASDGEIAAQKLREGSYDAIVSDIAMPRMTGIDLLRVVREHDLDVPVVLVTGSASLDTAMDAVRFGALRYLQKPFELDELVEVVERAVGLARIARAKRDAMILLGEHHRLLGDRAALEAHFERAVKSLWMAYQPIVAWSTRSTYAFEALVRSDDATLSHPGALFDAAERIGQLHTLGRAIRAAVAATVSGTSSLTFVNLHSRDLLDDTLFHADAPLSRIASRVVLEITERATLDEIDSPHERLDALRKLGFRIALDDLGAGYAGLASFAQLRPDVVKLDMSLVRDIDRDPTRRRLVGSMLSVCGDLRMLSVVEGVETIAERDVLVELGAELFQGYVFARPARVFPTPTF